MAGRVAGCLPLAFFAIPTPRGLTPKRVRRAPLTLGESPHTVRIDPCMQRVCCLPVQASSAA
jgi:hypothetical protein